MSRRSDGSGPQEVRVLYVEDNQQTGSLVRDWLERHDDRFEVTLALSLGDGIEKAEEGAFDAVVADYRFPEGTGLDLLEAVREHDPGLPFLLYSARVDRAVKQEAWEAGADAVIPKGDATQLGELADRIVAAVEGRLATGSAPEAEDRSQIEAFAAEVAHDLRGELSVAYGHLDMLDADGEHADGVREALEEIEATVDDLTARAAVFEGGDRGE